MSMKFFRLILVLFLFTFPVARAQNEFCGITNRCIQPGEKINFKVYYNLSAIWIAAGEANFTTSLEQEKGRNLYHIVGEGHTYDSYDWIFRVRDKYQTYLDAATLLPVKFLRDVDEGGYKIINRVAFDQKNRKAYSNNKTFSVPECVQDILSAIYYARNIDYNKYKPGAKIPFQLFLDDEVYALYIRYLGKERISTKYGTFNAIKLAPLLIKGTIFEGGEQMEIWISDDGNHLPLRINSPILVGSVKVDMMGYQHLKFPLSSLIRKQ